MMNNSPEISMKMVTPRETPREHRILIQEIRDKGILTLNRPEAMNAPDLEMSAEISVFLNKWKNTKSLILIKGSGQKAFCAGGDVKKHVTSGDMYKAIRQSVINMYPLNYLIGNLSIPFVAFIDGIVMGAGAGLAVHGKYRLATERTVYAMPEVAIGHFPDCGHTYFLPRLSKKLGFYLGLTGARLKGEDAWHAGVATHYCHSSKLPEIERALLGTTNSDEVEQVLNHFCPRPTSEYTLFDKLQRINKYFNASTVEEILYNLEGDDSEWAKHTIKTLRAVSPTALKVTLHAYNLGTKLSFEECLQMEYRLCLRFATSHDFREGVHSVLVTKNKNPKWNPSQIELVTDEKVLSFFQPLPNNEVLSLDIQFTSKL